LQGLRTGEGEGEGPEEGTSPTEVGRYILP